MAAEKKQWEQGRHWIALIGMALSMFIQQGFLQTYGLLYLDLLDLFREGPEKTGLMATICSISGALMSLLAGWIADLVSPRALLVGCALTACAGTLMCAFAPSMDLVIVGYGVLRGGVIQAFLTVVMGYLAKLYPYNRPLASGIAISMGSLGAMVYPLAYRWLVDIYSTRGTLLVLSAFDLNFLLFPFLLPKEEEEQDRYKKKKTTIKHTATPARDELKDNREDNNSFTTEIVNHRISAHGTCQKELTLQASSTRRNGNCHAHDHDDASDNKVVVTVLNPKSLALEPNSVSKTTEVYHKGANKTEKFKLDKLMVASFILVILYHGWYCFGYYGFLAYSPAYADELGINSIQQSLLLTVSGLATMVGRIFLGAMGNIKCVNIYLLTASCFIASSVAILSLPELLQIADRFWLLMGAIIIQGFLGGGASSLGAQFIVDAVGVERSIKGAGILCVSFSVGISMPPLLFGWLKTKTGSYSLVPTICGITYIISAFFILLSRYFKSLVSWKCRSSRVYIFS